MIGNERMNWELGTRKWEQEPELAPRMDEYVSNSTLDAIADELREAQHIVVTTHAKPDGDALGSVLAMGAALEKAGKTVERWIMPPIVGSLQRLAVGVELHTHETDDDPLPTASGSEPDRIVVMDTGAWAQLSPMRSWLEPRRERVLLIDHHLRGDDIARLRYIDPSAAAACELVADCIAKLGVAIDTPIANAIYAGLATDTGWFRFSNTTANTLRIAADMLDAGVDHAAIYAQLEQGERPQKMALLTRALENMVMVADHRAAIMTLRAADFADTGARPEETERLVDIPQMVHDVQVVVLLTEDAATGGARMSFRSKPGPNAINVSTLAHTFGGGGHARAAGAKCLDEPLDDVRKRVIDAVEQLCR